MAIAHLRTNEPCREASGPGNWERTATHYPECWKEHPKCANLRLLAQGVPDQMVNGRWTCRSHGDECKSYVRAGRDWNERGVNLANLDQLSKEDLVYAVKCLRWVPRNLTRPPAGRE